MKVVITCGHQQSGDALVHNLLRQAGLADAALSRRESMHVHELQSRMLTVLQIDTDAGVAAPSAPGRVWDELAMDLFLANMAAPVWGWNSPATLPLLEYWHEFDPQARFVLVYAPPEFAICQALQEQEATPVLVKELLSSWMRANHRLLHFYHRHPERSELVNVRTALSAPAQLLERLNERWQLDLRAKPERTRDAGAHSLVASVLARAAVRDDERVLPLFAELESVTSLETPDVVPGEDLAAWNEFAGLQRERAAATDAAGRLRMQLGGLEQTLSELSEQARQLTDARNAMTQLQQELDEVRLESQAERNALHPVLRERDEAVRIAAEQAARISDLQWELDAAGADAVRQRAQLNELKNDFEARAHFADPTPLLAREKQLQQDNELLLGQLHQVQAEMEELFAKSQQLAKRSEELTRTLDAERSAGSARQTQLLEERETLRKLAAEQRSQIVQLTRERDAAVDEQSRCAVDEAAEARNKELTQENELLLLQLQQVQEELEHYFLQSQEVSRRSGALAAAEASARWFWLANQPSEVVVDMRGDIDGANWHEAEADGRWAGPGKSSTLRIPALAPGEYLMALHVVDTMAPEILQGMQVLLNGHRIDLPLDEPPALPAVLQAQFGSDAAGSDDHWQFEFRFPAVISPSEQGIPDYRSLAVRLKALELILTAPRDA